MGKRMSFCTTYNICGRCEPLLKKLYASKAVVLVLRYIHTEALYMPSSSKFVFVPFYSFILEHNTYILFFFFFSLKIKLF